MNKIWRPFTQEKITPKSVKAIKGEGSYIFDESGNKYLDLTSSWWVNLHGHANKKIAQAIYDQAKTLEHVIFTKFTHDPAEKLCSLLSSVLHPKLCKFFFADNGATSVEIALKIACQYWDNIGYPNKSKFVSFEQGYHGDTFGAMALGSGYHDKFAHMCFKGHKIPFPATWIGDDDIEEKEEKAIISYKNCLEQDAHNIAAIIIEPMIQASSGMRIVSSEFMRKIFDLSKKYNVLIICDEVMTGFFRTGKMFAYEYINHDNSHYVPDIICLSKGLTGGFLPLGLTVASEEIFNTFLGDDFSNALVHGHSYCGNPISCAASIASFDILYSSECQNSIKDISKINVEWSSKLLQSRTVNNIRTLGTVLAFDTDFDTKKMKIVVDKMFERGFFMRPLMEKTLYIIPPYSTSINDLNNAYSSLLEVFDD